MSASKEPAATRHRAFSWQEALWWTVLVAVLLTGWGLRTLGRNWDETYGLHPDERFLTMVLVSVEPTFSLRELLDTARSPMNPANRGFGFYVYGDLPLFLVRYLAYALKQEGYGQMMLLARAVSAVADTLTLALVVWLGYRLLGRRGSVLAGALYAFSVLPIQQSHFGTVDTLTTFFLTLCLVLAVELALRPEPFRPPALLWFAAFALVYAAAMASKLSALPAALLLPAAIALRWHLWPQRMTQEAGWAFSGLLLAGVLSFLFFRLFQPYAFTGPQFWDIRLNPQWVANLKALQAQTQGTADFPPAMQWARRPRWFGWQNYSLWGVGPGLAAWVWAAVAALGYRLWKTRRGSALALVWAWGVLYFLWQSLGRNPTMRYFLPAYPALSLVAAWAMVRAWEASSRWRRVAARAAVLLAVAVTAGWALAFVHIYTRPHTRMAASRWMFQNLPGPVNLVIETETGRRQQPLSIPLAGELTAERPLQVVFPARESGRLTQVTLYRVEHLTERPIPARLEVRVRLLGQEQPLAKGEASLPLPTPREQPARPITLDLQPQVPLQAGKMYALELRVDGGRFRLSGTYIVNETSWDDPLPLRIDGYDPFGGLYQGDLLELYWDDNEEKRERVASLLDLADVVLITSSRQWGSLPRLPERYPLVIAYYYGLTGCPMTEPLEPCLNRLQPGMYESPLGFELVQVFESPPTLGPLRINDQPAEEAFTVYDHPKVFVFRKTAAYDPERTRNWLAAVDLRYIRRVPPGQAPSHPANLFLPPDRWALAQHAGTWRDLFPPSSFLNRYPWAALPVWYVLIAVLGLAAWPYLWPVFGAAAHRGYPYLRIAGMLLWAWMAWVAAHLGPPLTRGVLWGVFLLYLLGSAALFYLQRRDMLPWLRHHYRELLAWEGWFLAFFAFDLFLRVMNPDLWHPARGGERPMELSYLHAVLKSVRFPPYDPWFAGGYMNYYYWGFVLVGMPIKLLGLRTEVAFNLVLPTLYGSTALAAMGLARSLYRWAAAWWNPRREVWVGLLAGLLAVVVGNLGTVQMFWRGLQILGKGPDALQDPLLLRWGYALKGALAWLAGATMPYGLGEWYWNPSRIIPAPGDVPPITEFPFFSFLYSDLHPHLIAFPVTLLAMAWAWSLVHRPRGLLRWPRILVTLFWGGLIVGSLRAINTWDFPTYLLLGTLALVYVGWKMKEMPPARRVPVVLAWVVGLVLAAQLLWQPYLNWYAQGYKSVTLWQGTRTPIYAYLWHWGLLLFLLATSLAYAWVRWLQTTPALDLLWWWRRWGTEMLVAQGLLLTATVMLWAIGVPVALVAGPLLMVLAPILVLPRWPDPARFAALLAAMALALTLMVEVVVIRGDIGRMNMVFKFYLQAWLLLAVAAAVWTGWTFLAAARPSAWHQVWSWAAMALLAGSLLYTLIASAAKIKDRWVPQAPRGLDGMAYMPQAVYFDQGQAIPLAEDYRAILWLRENVQGSPVIVEANTPEYRWGTRFTIYTGLPGVVGWSWHQRQQRGVVTSDTWVTQRVAEVATFYRTLDRAWVEDFLRRYQVQYVIVGRLEKAYYPGPGLEKFPAWNGVLWDAVYQDGETTIYRVRRAALLNPPK